MDMARYVDHVRNDAGVLSPDVFMLSLSGVSLYKTMNIVRDGHSINKEFMLLRNPASTNYTVTSIYDSEQPTFFGGDRNFGHWCFEWLPRLSIIDNFATKDNVCLHVWDDIPDRYLEFLDILGYKYRKIQPGIYYEYDVNIPSSPVGRYRNVPYVHKTSIKRLVDMCTAAIKRDTSRTRLYVPRVGGHRLVLNDDAVQATLVSAGYEVVELDKYPVIDQIRIMAHAESVVIPSGAGSPITMFTPGKVLEFAPPGLDGIFGARIWAIAKGTPYKRITGLVQGVPDNPRDASYTVDIEELKRVINA
jgi:hypothetical protein